MPDNRDYITSADENGSISISEDVVSTIAALAVSEVDGVSGLAGPTAAMEDISDRKSLARALKISSTESGEVLADISIRVRYGAKIPAVAAALQNAVEQAIESYAGLTVSTVNVHVVGIDFPTQEAE